MLLAVPAVAQATPHRCARPPLPVSRRATDRVDSVQRPPRLPHCVRRGLADRMASSHSHRRPWPRTTTTCITPPAAWLPVVWRGAFRHRDRTIRRLYRPACVQRIARSSGHSAPS